MLQHEHLARELVEALRDGATSTVVALTDELDQELTRLFKLRAEHRREAKLAILLHNTKDVQVDSEPVLAVTTASVWVSAFVRVSREHTGATNFGDLE